MERIFHQLTDSVVRIELYRARGARLTLFVRVQLRLARVVDLDISVSFQFW